ncbi:unnamed protein product [Protopolystoma xenopodis]|uniref:Uncharacterized protein n=1 Tax=Protopolystoma xenopodis TaxID=117903 RepID=A0A3S5B636_9PLAT|nr:unnamed protein product [Protopolystoma xenopodis]
MVAGSTPHLFHRLIFRISGRIESPNVDWNGSAWRSETRRHELAEEETRMANNEAKIALFVAPMLMDPWSVSSLAPSSVASVRLTPTLCRARVPALTIRRNFKKQIAAKDMSWSGKVCFTLHIFKLTDPTL